MQPQALTLATPVRFLKGVGPVRAQQLRRLGVDTVEELLCLVPIHYLQRGALAPIAAVREGQRCLARGTVLDVQLSRRRPGPTRVLAVVGDGGGTLLLTWFNAAWMARRLHVGDVVVVSGEVGRFAGRLQMLNPQLEGEEEALQEPAGRLLPVYPLTAGLRQGTLRKLVFAVLPLALPLVTDPLPQDWLREAGLPSRRTALLALHRPDREEEAVAAQRRLAFEEAVALQLSLGIRRRGLLRRPATVVLPPLSDLSRRFVEGLPYALTRAQRRALAEIRRDLASPVAMHRMLQGDVGSGKTLVALIAMLWLAESGAQAAFMAPTAVLAHQHAQRHLPALQALGIRGALLTSSTPGAQRPALRAGLRDGSLSIVFGTHALLQDEVRFARLGLAVIDEQHRFGVLHRAQLGGWGAHLLVMSATPIPRSLALTLYGDLDLSVLDELPPGRAPVRTQVASPTELPGIYTQVAERAARGEQCYLVFPVIRATESSDVASVLASHAELVRGPLRGMRVGLLHGQLPARQKEAVSAAFARGELDVLVATTVVEVGLDVAMATLMVVHHAERFGLAQLHQLRGRVGRGARPGECVLVCGEEAGPSARRRLAQLGAIHDGFALAELDLQSRGMGDLQGVRQHGETPLRFLRPLEHADLVARARELVDSVLERDPALRRPEHATLAAWLQALVGASPFWSAAG
jgi:ATP-dependent DNA helicase RecG